MLLLLAGCASPGVPRPPSLHLPAPVRDLSALRTGDIVQLHFTAPEQTTDHQELMRKGVPVPLTAVVCRVQGATCLAIERLRIAPGQPVDTTDSLPPPLTVGPGRPVAYRVRVENPLGRDAGYSRDALAAAGAAPPEVAGLAATTVAGGVQLTWQAATGQRDPIRVEAQLLEAGAPAPSPSGITARRPSVRAERLLEIRPVPRDPGGAVDPAPLVGARIEYRVYREREVQVNGTALPLRSASATVLAVRSADVFAPAAPVGVLAVSFSTEGAGPAVSLSWEPGSEPDVAGYNVYRALGAGPFERVTAAPVTGLSYQDTARAVLVPGAHLRYAVTAVDRSGNESARSAVAEADVR